jgi:hypothetical protein
VEAPAGHVQLEQEQGQEGPEREAPAGQVHLEQEQGQKGTEREVPAGQVHLEQEQGGPERVVLGQVGPQQMRRERLVVLAEHDWQKLRPQQLKSEQLQPEREHL